MPETEELPKTDPAPRRLPRIFIATPAYGGKLDLCYIQGLIPTLRAADKQGVEIVLWMQGNESHINRARNYAVEHFLKSGCDYLFFIDADIAFTPDSFGQLATYAFEHDVDVVAGAYPMKEIVWERAMDALSRGQDPAKSASRIVVHRLDVDPKGLGYVEGYGAAIEVKECGTGFMCISRRCIEAMIAAHPEVIYDSDDTPKRKIYNLFHADVVDDIFMGEPSRRWLTEDYWFCRQWREMGGKIWLHLGVELGHWGTHEHRGNPHEVHGGPAKGMRADPGEKERVMAILQGCMMPEPRPTEPPRLIVQHDAKEGAFALWAGHQWPDVVFDLYEPNPTTREMLRENFAMYGLRGQVHESPPAATYARPYWRVSQDKIEVLT